LRFTPTSKNQPARDFLENDLSRYRESAREHIEYRVPVDFALRIGDRRSKHARTPPEAVSFTASPATDGTRERHRAAQIAWIASHMTDTEKIWGSIRAWKQKTRPELRTAFILPRSELEQSLAQIWREILEVNEVGVNDNFFGLGGDSLAMVRTVIRIYERLGVELPISAFAEEPTVEAHSRKIAALQPNPKI
jgi:acyl carrier protein